MEALPKLSIAMALVFFSSVQSLYAQSSARPERPYRGLFQGSAPASSARSESLTVNASFGGGYDSNILASEALGLDFDSPDPEGGTFGLASAGVAYSITRERVSFSAAGNGSVYHYPKLEDSWVRRTGVSANVSWSVTQRTTLRASQTVAFDPFYSLLPFAVSGAPPVEADILETAQALRLDPRRTYGTTLGANHELTQRVSIFADGSFYKATSESHDYDSTGRQLGGGVRWALTRHLSLRAGYRTTEVTFGDEESGGETSSSARSIDAGVDYNRSVSLSRRTTLGFGSGFAGINDGEDTSYSLVGHVTLSHEIGRDWSTSVGYSRDVRFVELLQEAVFSDNLNASLGGLLTRGLAAEASASFSHGNSGAENTEDSFSNALGAASLTWALSRNVATSLTYTFYWYDFSRPVLPAGFPTETRRHSITAQLQLWAPIFQRPRRPNATR